MSLLRIEPQLTLAFGDHFTQNIISDVHNIWFQQSLITNEEELYCRGTAECSLVQEIMKL